MPDHNHTIEGHEARVRGMGKMRVIVAAELDGKVGGWVMKVTSGDGKWSVCQ